MPQCFILKGYNVGMSTIEFICNSKCTPDNPETNPSAKLSFLFTVMTFK